MRNGELNQSRWQIHYLRVVFHTHHQNRKWSSVEFLIFILGNLQQSNSIYERQHLKDNEIIREKNQTIQFQIEKRNQPRTYLIIWKTLRKNNKVDPKKKF